MIQVQSNKSLQTQSSKSDLTSCSNDQKNSSGFDIKNHIDGRGSVRKTLSATLSVRNKGTTTALCSSSSQFVIHSSFGGSRMIQRMFVSCLVFVICTIYYGNYNGMTITTHNSMSTSIQHNHNNQNLLGIFDQIGVNEPSNTAHTGRMTLTNQLSNDVATGITKASKASISTYVQKETKRMIQSDHNNKSLSMYPCINSDRWLTSKRYGNINDDTLLTHDLVQHMILNLENALIVKDDNDNIDQGGSVMAAVLKQTICHKQSRFLKQPTSYNHFVSSMNSNEPLSNNTRTVRLWAVKLIYLAIHYHQHRLAVPEAVIRYQSDGVIPPSTLTNKTCLARNPQFLQQTYNVGIFDYECPDAKYIIMPLGGNGLGSNVRGGMVVAFLIGLSTDRIVLFVNNAQGANHNLHKKWSLASCPRNDYQCFFWPTSPCTLTNDEINNAYALTRDDYRKVIKENDELKHIEQHKVWSFNTPFLPVVHLPSHAGERLYQYAATLISAISKEKFPKYHALLLEATESIRIADTTRDGYNYAAANTKVQHALAFYSMRPNPRNAYELDQILNHIIPETFPPETSIGLPIRASDKCSGESECLSFEQHMQVTSAMWQKHIDQGSTIRVDPTVVFTTEATSMVKEQQAFVAQNGESKFPFKFEFVTNTKDVTPDSGFMKDIVYNKDVNSDADSIMLSAISSLKAQLLPRISIGNCCSNFHTLLNDFLSEGCGAASDNTFLCLQEYEDPRLRVCCGWHKKCIAEKMKLINATIR